jgi:hypothetical protein
MQKAHLRTDRSELQWTKILAVATLLLVAVTAWLVFETRRASTRQLGVETWLTLVARFHSKEMMRARKTLAIQLGSYDPATHDELNEMTLDFFEDLGTAYKSGYLDKHMAESTFSYYVNYWWAASEKYVHNERLEGGVDLSSYSDFEDLAKAMHHDDLDIDSKSLKQFLEDEKHLDVD